MEKIKLLFCHDRIIMGGVEKAFLEIATGLLKTGKFDISIWCKTKITDQYFLDFFKENGIKIYDHLYDEPKSAFLIEDVARFFRRFSNKYLNDKLFFKYAEESDVIIDFKNGCMQSRIKKIKNKLKIVWLQCSFDTITRDIKTDCSAYDKVVCISNKLREDMARRYPKLGKKFETIYIPFDIEKIRRLADEKNSKKELKLLSEDYFAVVARLSRDKDFDTLILAYKMFLDKTSSKTKLYFAGDGHDRKRLEKMVADYELSKMALFLGQVETPYSLIKNSKALVLSSRNEGAPLTLIEGMILKTIIVSSDCPTAPRELLDDGKCGVLFEPGNAIELKNIMIKIDRNEICREQFSQNIDKWIGRFDINQTIGKYLSIVKQI